MSFFRPAGAASAMSRLGYARVPSCCHVLVGTEAVCSEREECSVETSKVFTYFMA